MCVSFILMTLAGFVCTFGPQPKFGVWPSYLIFVAARFLLACSTRGISESGFVLGSEMGRPYGCRRNLFRRKMFSCTEKTSENRIDHELFLHIGRISSGFPRLFHSNLALLNTHHHIIHDSLLFLLLVSIVLCRVFTIWPS